MPRLPRNPHSPKPDPAGVALTTGDPCEYSADERSLLLKLAHDVIAARFEHGAISLEPPTAHLAEPRGAFTTVYVQGELRGCVGYPLPVAPLYRTVGETACSAAFEDMRFPPLERSELPHLGISISVLSPLSPIEPDQVEVGRHGLLLSLGGRRGLLLPQVPFEHGWDRVAFLEQTCQKAGLPSDAWKRGARLEAFTAEIFADSGVEV